MSASHEVRVALEGGMHFIGLGHPLEDGFTVHMDTSPDFGGEHKGMRPQSLMLVSLGGCTGMDVISILRKKRQQVSGLEVIVRAERADEHPRVYTHIWLTYVVRGQDVDPAAVERAVDLSLTKYCPVAGLLRQVVPIESDYQIVNG